MEDDIVIMDGKSLATKIKELEQNYIENEKGGYRRPSLVVIEIGDNDASKVYLKNKEKACKDVGIDFILKHFDEKVSKKELSEEIQLLNKNKNIDGIFLQQPFPLHLRGIEQEILPEKDVDGFTLSNLGNTLYNGKFQLNACTPSGIMYLLREYNIPLQGKHVVIVGRSNIVGKPLIGLLLQENATVTSCNSYTEDLWDYTRKADILITAMGKSKKIDANYISSKCFCIIDVGMNRDENNKLCGDVDFDNIIDYWNYTNYPVETKKRYITPVPGGVGPMTVASLIRNVNIAYTRNLDKYYNEKYSKLGGQ
ncbi:bifunctional 5,10-methylenetetrahydrofolate dehydrogenase/5,10-methenyltetrahydrofolate cyclohydrolase [uncultured Clostridium sp.]|uniref:bifunctional 5,10-methylenetetrahydrofolate dehydrogenase/5,10-methenyltetrahydrofolate cyclohydrolase n=1 Tax=uncultured Clostridium sp. TaxID=59620 RepID=UPI0026024A85|nr:bifunctional 5,10-methylenetetrahydrofolate dehydrogenase/5,10-methenyltetrahydrofolate cyclohydrolase [uncultured Clostridium sp.]